VTPVLIASALAMGLLGGAHCVAMCGGVVGVLCAGLPPAVRARPIGQLRYVLAYNAGRVASYAAVGAIACAVGMAADRADGVYGAQLGLRVVAGLLMLGLGLYLAGLFRRFSALEKLGAPVWRVVEPIGKRLLPVRSAAGALALGALWGFMPCGLVYASAALAVTTGSPVEGAVAMVAFGAGTLPTLVALGGMAAFVARWVARAWVRKGAGIAIACFGLVQLGVAASQVGVSPLVGSAPACCATARR
jgi:sulfite exporter TauE/SafE